MGSAIDLLVAIVGGSTSSETTFVTALRTFRLARVLRLVKRAKVLNEIISGLYFTALGLFNVFAMLFLLLFVYTIMGVQVQTKTLLLTCALDLQYL